MIISDFIGKVVKSIHTDSGAWLITFEDGSAVFFNATEFGDFFDRAGEMASNDIEQIGFAEMFAMLPSAINSVDV